MYSNFMFLNQFLFELSCKKHTHTETHTHTHTHTDALKDSDEYSIFVFCKNATIKITHKCRRLIKVGD